MTIQKVNSAVNTEGEVSHHVDQSTKKDVGTSGSYIINHPKGITFKINLNSMQILHPSCELYLIYKLFIHG